MNENLLQTIDSIDDIIEESEMNVCAALYDEYQKMFLLLEYADMDVCEEMTIFQEAATKNEKSDDKTSSKKTSRIVSALKKVGGAIAHFFQMIGEKIAKLWKLLKEGPKNLSKKFINAVGEITGKNVKDDDVTYKKHIDTINDIYERIKEPDTLEKFSQANLPYIRKSIKTLKSLKENLGFKSEKSKDKVKELIEKINKCIETLEEYEKIYMDFKVKYKLNTDKEKDFNEEFKDFMAEQKTNCQAIRESLRDIMSKLGNLPLKDDKTYATNQDDLDDLGDFIEVLLAYSVGLKIANDTTLHAQLQRAGIFKSPVKDLSGMKKFSSILGPIENVRMKEDNVYIEYMKKMQSKAEEILTTFKKDTRGYFDVKMTKTAAIDSITFWHIWNQVPPNIRLASEQYKGARVKMFSGDINTIHAEIKKIKKILDVIEDNFIREDRGFTELPSEMDSSSDGFDINIAVSNITNNKNLTDEAKEEIIKELQTEIYKPLMLYMSIYLRFQDDVWFGMRAVWNIIYETHKEAWDNAPKNDVKDSDVFTMKDK